MIQATFNLDKVIDVADRFGAIDAVRGILLSQPDKATAKLADVLEELAKTVSVLDDEMVRYLSLHFHSDESIERGRGVLLGMEVGKSIIRMNEMRGHCHKIKNIYDAYLNTWFDRVFNANLPQRNELKSTFDDLTTSDDYIIEAMKQVSEWLEIHAGQTLDAVDLNDLIGANHQIRQARLEAKDARIELTKAMGNLRGLQADLIGQLGTV